MTTEAAKIQLHRGDAASWAANNPVLAEGELGVELDTRKFKFGDGTTAWTSLAYASSSISGALTYQGALDCSTSPNYPAANKGDTYRVSVAGKVGGASGVNVEVGDLLVCLADSTASGNQATVGSSWEIAQANLDGAVVGPSSSTDGHVAVFNGTSGKVVKDGGALGTAAAQPTSAFDAAGAAAAAAAASDPVGTAAAAVAAEAVARAAADALRMPLDLSTLTELLSASIAAGDWVGVEHLGATYKAQMGSLATYLHQGLLGRPGRLNIDGDSRTQLGPAGNTSAGYPSGNFSHALAALLGVAPTEIRHRGASGSRAATAWRTTVLRQGTGVVAMHVVPPNWQMFGQPSYASSHAGPGLSLCCYGLNAFASDASHINQTTFAQCNAAEINGQRFIVARDRLARLFPANTSLAVYAQGAGGSNGWGSVALDYVTAGICKQTVVNGNIATFTLPVLIDGNTTFDISFLSSPNFYCTIATPSGGATSPTTITVDAIPSILPGTGTLAVPTTGGIVNASYSSKTGTVFTLDTAGQTALSGKTLSANGTAMVLAAGATVTISGTAANATGSVLLGGQGQSGEPCHIVKRIAITPADAGKTVILTTSGILTGEIVTVDSYGIEDTDPPPVFVYNVPPFAYSGSYTTAGTDDTSLTGLSFTAASNVSTMNAALASMVAEFDAQVKIVDLYTQFKSLFMGTLAANAGTGTTIQFTPFDAPNCVVTIGSQLRTRNEEIQVTGIDKTHGGSNDGVWTLTVTRATSSEGAATGLAQNWISGSAIFDTRAFCPDRVHWSREGAVVVVATSLAALATMSPTNRQIAVSGAYKGQQIARVGDGTYIGPYDVTGTTPSNAAIPAIDTAYAFHLPVHEPLQIVAFVMTIGSANIASSLIRMGLWLDGPGVPGQPLVDSGDISSAVSSGTVLTYTLPYPFDLDPGLYWIGYKAAVAAGNFKCIGSAAHQGMISSSGVPPTGTARDNHAMSWSNGTGAGVALAACPIQIFGGGTPITANTSLPRIVALVKVAPRD